MRLTWDVVMVHKVTSQRGSATRLPGGNPAPSYTYSADWQPFGGYTEALTLTHSETGEAP